MSIRKTAVYLNIEQKWEVAKYCIEHKGIMQDKTGIFSIFRVVPSKLAIEVNECFSELGGVSGHHITDSVLVYNTIAKLTNNLPVVPLTSSVQEDMLTAEVELLKGELKKSQDELLKAAGIINNYKERFLQIRKLATS